MEKTNIENIISRNSDQPIKLIEKDKKMDLLLIAVLSFIVGTAIHDLSSDIIEAYAPKKIILSKAIYTLAVTILVVMIVKKYDKI